MKLFSNVKSPREWLAQLLDRKRMSQRALATELQRDSSQVNKWFSGKEPIPEAMFIAAAAAIDPRFEDQAASLWAAHTMAEAVMADSVRHLESIDEPAARKAAMELITRAEVSALDFGSDADPECYTNLRRYLTDAHSILRLVSACLSQRSEFIAPKNIEKHLRFPFNLMGGDLLGQNHVMRTDRELIRQTLISSMKTTALSKDPSNQGVYCRQHAYYMLSRYGSPHDNHFVQELAGKATDLHTRRTARYAEIINVEEPAAADRFIFELSHDSRFSAVTLEFDFVHYGDKLLTDSQPRSDIRGTVRNHLRRTSQRSAPSQICLYKLCYILREFGMATFETKTIRPRIESLLAQLHAIAPEKRTVAEKHFIATFGAHGLFLPTHWQQLELLSLQALVPAYSAQ